MHGLAKRMLRKKFQCSKKDIKNSRKRSNMKLQPKKSNLKPNEDRIIAVTTEAEAEKEKEKKAVVGKEKSAAETDTRCKHRSSEMEASDDKMQCTFTSKQRRNDKE